MPIYEFYCKKCNTIYKFFSKVVNTEKVPDCPKCKKSKLQRQVSVFSFSSGKKDEGENDVPPIDESKMERAMGMLAQEAGKIDEEDPRQAAQLMRKLTDASGIKMGPGMEEALHRLEKGEDPEKIEQEIGDLLEGEEPFILDSKNKTGSKKPNPQIDDTIYDL
jgi:putative FmdB family regulatory protein